jgi:predicted nucleotidyltransferase
MDDSIIEKLKILKFEASKYLKFENLVLYGSYSDGTFNQNSDIDVAFLTNEITDDFWKISAKLFELVDKIDNRIEPLILNLNNDKSGFAHRIRNCGIII